MDDSVSQFSITVLYTRLPHFFALFCIPEIPLNLIVSVLVRFLYTDANCSSGPNAKFEIVLSEGK